MANLIDMTTSTLALNTFCFETRDIDTEKIPIPFDNAKFGILNFAAVTSPETKNELEFLFIIDCSGSMSDKCSDRRTKMQHIIHTLKNMIIFLHDNTSINANITVNAFDTNIYKIVERTRITDDNLNQILEKIEKIHPRGSTNIQYALTKSAEEIQNLKTQFPTHIVNHIFMTDGEATDGSSDISVLKSLVLADTMNAFIGFGLEHDSTLLNAFGSVGKSSYHFVDKLESAGFIYGEILHSVIYKLLTNAEINLKNGLIYDYQNNVWINKLSIGDIISEANKTYNIVSNNLDEFSVEIKAKFDDLVVLYPSTRLEDTDLTNHIFRQRTLQIMSEVKDYCKLKREIADRYNHFTLPQINDENSHDELRVQKTALKKKLIEFMDEMKKYMSENDLMDDKFMKNLCDDIFICFRTFDTKYGNMYCTARQTSQGTQRQYTVSNTDALDNDNIDTVSYNALYPPRLARGRHYTQRQIAFAAPPIDNQEENTFNMGNLFDDDDDDIIIPHPVMRHEVSDFADTPYLTPQATQVMRFISSQTAHDDDESNISSSTQHLY
jgi:hypothetical protein